MTRFRKRFLIFLCLILSFFCLSFISIINVNAIEEPESKGSTYTITIPQTITLDENGFAEYQISVVGDLSSVVSISVIPDETFTLSSFDKDDITATVTQDKTVWTPADADVDAQGSIYAEMTAGVWTGAFNFNVSIEEKEEVYELSGSWQFNEDINIVENLSQIENANIAKSVDGLGDVVCDLPPDKSDENIPA